MQRLEIQIAASCQSFSEEVHSFLLVLDPHKRGAGEIILAFRPFLCLRAVRQ